MKRSVIWSGLRGTLFSVVAFSTALTGSVAAEEPTSGTAGSPAPTGSATPAATPAAAPSAPLRRDALGVKGLSPQMEAMLRGDAAFLARDFVGALDEYTTAAKLAPKDPLPHLRMAELHLAEKRFVDCQESLATVRRFAGARTDLLARAAFLFAALREAENKVPEAITAYDDYVTIAATHLRESEKNVAAGGAPAPTAHLHAETAIERRKVLETHAKTQTDYQAVKARIESEVAAADAGLQKKP